MDKLEQLQEEWNKDCVIDITNISREIVNVPFLHSKYLTKYSNEHLKLLKIRKDYNKLVNLKEDYYKGILDPDELKERGWKPFPLKIRPSELERYIEGDDDIITASLKVGYQEEICKALESICKSIAYRGNNLRTLVDYERFKAGS